MANIFVALPAPAANGAGAWVDVSSFGALKTITVTGNGGVFEPFVTIECSNQNAPTAGFALKTFGFPAEQSFGVACHWMRAVVSNYRGGGAPTVEVGGTDDGTSFAQLISPAGDGDGAGVDVSALPPFKTVQIVGAYRGTVNVEVSEDAGTTYSQAFSSTNQPGGQSQTIAADFMRVSRAGTPKMDPGLPEIWIGATAGSGGGGGGIGVNVQDEGVPLANNPHPTLNFIGAGVTATDAGGGIADIDIPGGLLPVVTFSPPADSPPITLEAGKTNVISTTDGVQANFPLAASVANGTMLVVRLQDLTFNLIDGDITGQVPLFTSGSDKLDGQAPQYVNVIPDRVGQSLLWVSDGVDEWYLQADFEPNPDDFPDEQAFIQPLTGAENPDGFTVDLPTAMADTNYIVELTLEIVGSAPFGFYQAEVNTKAVDHIVVIFTDTPNAGDKLFVFIKEITGSPP